MGDGGGVGRGECLVVFMSKVRFRVVHNRFGIVRPYYGSFNLHVII